MKAIESPGFTLWDVVVLVVFYVCVFFLSIIKSRHKTQTTADYFLGGRSLPWWLIGISIVAANISTEQMVGMAGQAAGTVGLAVSTWQLAGSIGIVIIAFTLLPKLLQTGVYTIPEFLELRYCPLARAIMAIFTVVIYGTVLVTAVLYSGAITLQTIFGLSLQTAVVILALLATIYTVAGGLRAVAWADLLQGLLLLGGGLLIFALGIDACGGWSTFVDRGGSKLHMVLPADHPNLPWTGVASGMWLVILYYCGLNQFIVQRALAAKSVRDGQLGMIFAGALWLLIPVAVVMPGIIAHVLYGDQLQRPDQAFPTLIRNLVPQGLRGLILASIIAAVVSSLASMLNSAATVFTLDVYQRLLYRTASQRHLVFVGRVVTIIIVALAVCISPKLQDPRFGGVFNYIQNFQGYIWPGVTAAFLVGFLVPHAPPSAGVLALISGPIIYGVFQFFAPNLHFLVQVALTFQLVVAIMALATFLKPSPVPWHTQSLSQILQEPPSKAVYIAGGLVIVLALSYFFVFW